MSKEKKQVSQLFVDTYLNFNVFPQKENILKLSEREKYLLFLYCLDRHNEDDPVFLKQISSFSDYCLDIYKSLEVNTADSKVKSFKFPNDILESLFKEFNYFFNFDLINCLVGPDGLSLREPYNKSEIRDIRINLIIESKNEI